MSWKKPDNTWINSLRNEMSIKNVRTKKEPYKSEWNKNILYNPDIRQKQEEEEEDVVVVNIFEFISVCI